MNRKRVRQIVLALSLVVLGASSAASMRDFGRSRDPVDAWKSGPGVYHPPSIADAIGLIADMSTYLYHEARCGHMDKADAEKVWEATASGVKLDFPGWRVTDDMVMHGRMWLGRWRVDDVSCTEAAVANPSYVINNISYYSARQ